MIVFTPIPPESFVPCLGALMGLRHTKRIYVYNLLSYDIRFPKLSRLLPQAELMSDYAYQNDDSDQFEKEYFDYIDTQEPPFLDLMEILTKEYLDGLSLIIIQTSQNNPFCDSIVSSLTKYFYTRYGLKAIVVDSALDLDDINQSNSIFSPAGLTTIDHDITVVNAIAPNILAPGVIPGTINSPSLFYCVPEPVQHPTEEEYS